MTLFSGYLFTPLKQSCTFQHVHNHKRPSGGVQPEDDCELLQEIDDVTVMFKTKERASQQIFFNEVNWSYFNEDGNPDEDVAPSTGTNSSPTTESEVDFKEYTPSLLMDLKDFNSFAIKVVMRSRNPAMPPRIRDH